MIKKIIAAVLVNVLAFGGIIHHAHAEFHEIQKRKSLECLAMNIYFETKVKNSDYDSQRRFQNDLYIDNLIAKKSGDYNGDGDQEVYWKTNDGTAYLRALMHSDGNIQYANYQSELQMTEYLTSFGFSSEVQDLIGAGSSS